MADAILKTCSTCRQSKPVTMFGICRRLKDGLNPTCKSCRSLAAARQAERDPEINRRRYQAERDRRIKCAALQRERLGAEAIRLSNQAHYKKNRVAILAQVADYHSRVADAKKARYKADPAAQRERARAWIKANPVRANARNAARRASLLLATPAWANEFYIEEAYHLARLRTQMTGFKWHVDHQVPLKSASVCGLHVEHNLAVIPGTLNCGKRNWHWPDMP